MEVKGKNVKCSDCHADYFMGKVVFKPNITEEEAEQLFTKKQLTERQRYGTSVKGRKYRKSRRKKK